MDDFYHSPPQTETQMKANLSKYVEKVDNKALIELDVIVKQTCSKCRFPHFMLKQCYIGKLNLCITPLETKTKYTNPQYNIYNYLTSSYCFLYYSLKSVSQMSLADHHTEEMKPSTMLYLKVDSKKTMEVHSINRNIN